GAEPLREAGERPAGAERVAPAATLAAERLPVGPQLFVALPRVLVGQDGVRLVDVLELLLGGLVARVLVGVVVPGELAERLLDLGLGRGLGHAEDLVVVLVVHRHRLPSTVDAGTADRRVGRCAARSRTSECARSAARTRLALGASGRRRTVRRVGPLM